MFKHIKKIITEEKFKHPEWLFDNTQYLTVVGSEAYGISSNSSDVDLIGFAIEPKEYLLPNMYGYLTEFDDYPRFDQWQKHHIDDKDRKRQYDVSIYGLVRAFKLMYDGNPNMVEMLFTPRECVVHSTPMSEKIRKNRNLFLSKRFAWKCRMYGFSQLSKLKNRTYQEGSKRREIVAHYGHDVKYQSHIYRLINNSEQILLDEGLDLRKIKDHLKHVRDGNVTMEETLRWFNQKERELNELENKSKIPKKPNKTRIKQLLIECIEIHYGQIFEQKPEIEGVNLSERDILDIKRILQKL